MAVIKVLSLAAKAPLNAIISKVNGGTIIKHKLHVFNGILNGR